LNIKLCPGFLYKFCLKHFSRQTEQSGYIVLSVKYRLFLSDFYFLSRYSKNAQILYFIDILPVTVELFHADRRTDTKKLMTVFSRGHPVVFKYNIKMKLNISDEVHTGLFEMIVWVSTTCRTQYTSDSSICIFYLTETLPVFVTYLTGALYVHRL
jgi:hypothetical protein